MSLERQRAQPVTYADYHASLGAMPEAARAGTSTGFFSFAPAAPDATVNESERARGGRVPHGGYWCTPRAMTDLARDLRAAGILDDESARLLALQPELHPDYDRTVGALTGERANPDRPRDVLAVWEHRLAFERDRDLPDQRMIERILRIIRVLRRLATIAAASH